MKVIVLIDNNPHPSLDLATEHGLSVYVEADGCKWLVDVGASPLFIDNAQKLGVSIEDVDYVVLSHGHFDHAGGLRTFLEINTKATVLLSSQVEGLQFYSYRLKTRRNISIDQTIIQEYPDRFIPIEENIPVTQNTDIVCHFPKKYPKPKGNRSLFLSKGDVEVIDDFSHEIVLTVSSQRGIVAFSGCSHNGILNVLSACSEYHGSTSIAACIGGTHLLDSTPDNHYENAGELEEITQRLTADYPAMTLVTGHCTGQKAMQLLATEMGDRFAKFYSGAEFII